MRFRLILEYDGTEYSGWQIQPDRPTVQGELEKALRTVLREEVRVEAAGRTDAGVHARGQVAAFTTTGGPEPVRLQRSLNALTGAGLAVRALEPVADDFNPRRHARNRSYEYRIWNESWPSPFRRRTAWHVPHALDVPRMNEAAGRLVGEYDFSSFQAADCDADHPVRVIARSEVSREEGEILYRVTGTAFLRHMVRNVVGTLVEVGVGERSVEDFRGLLESRDRRLAGPTAPPQGLCLVFVEY